MKKTAGKIILILCCMAIVAFLALPFLETTAPQSAASANKKPTPQIFTANPLTELVNRIARFFNKRRAAEAPQKTLTEQETQEKFGTPQNEGVYADARAAGNYISTEESPSAGHAQMPAGFGNASFRDEDGEWVLIRQKAPDAGTLGMHEINSKDNAYDSYIRQERAARFTPTAAIKKEKAVPDSKWARLLNPIKRFFGFDSAERMLPNQNIWQEQEAMQLASSQGIGKSRNTTGSSFTPGNYPDMAGINGSGAYGTDDFASPEATLLSYLDPETTLDEVSNFLADSKYPNPQNNTEKQQKETYRQQRREEARQYFTQRVQERLNRIAAGQEPKDELKNLLEGACSNKTLRAVKTTACGKPVPAPATQQEIDSAKQENKNLFFRKTQKNMPPAAIMPVIGRATEIPPPLPPEGSVEGYTKTMEIYEFMFANKKCTDSPCYWVANSIQTGTDLSDSIEASGAKLRGDPLGKYSSIQQQFVEYKLKQAEPDADPQEIQKQTEDFAPAYILYTLEDLKTIQAANQAAVRNRDQQAGTAIYALSAPIAKQISTDLGATTFFYGRNDALINEDMYPSFKERSIVLTNDLADQIQFFQRIGQEIKRNAAREVVTENTRSNAQQIYKQAQQQMSAFDKSNALGKTERGQ